VNVASNSTVTPYTSYDSYNKAYWSKSYAATATVYSGLNGAFKHQCLPSINEGLPL